MKFLMIAFAVFVVLWLVTFTACVGIYGTWQGALIVGTISAYFIACLCGILVEVWTDA